MKSWQEELPRGCGLHCGNEPVCIQYKANQEPLFKEQKSNKTKQSHKANSKAALFAVMILLYFEKPPQIVSVQQLHFIILKRANTACTCDLYCRDGQPWKHSTVKCLTRGQDLRSYNIQIAPKTKTREIKLSPCAWAIVPSVAFISSGGSCCNCCRPSSCLLRNLEPHSV